MTAKGVAAIGIANVLKEGAAIFGCVEKARAAATLRAVTPSLEQQDPNEMPLFSEARVWRMVGVGKINHELRKDLSLRIHRVDCGKTGFSNGDLVSYHHLAGETAVVVGSSMANSAQMKHRNGSATPQKQ